MPGEEVIAEHVAVTVLMHALERLRRVRFLKCKVFRRGIDIRVSFSALLRISRGGTYVLVRNFYRPESFGPFGGVYKYHPTATPGLDKIVFKPEDLGSVDDTTNDLRGFLPRKNLSRLVKWFEGGDDRETASECLRRELKEELAEINLSTQLRFPSALNLRRIRTVEEGPERVPGQAYTQYRAFAVWEGIASERDSFDFLDALFKLASSHRDLLVATAPEIFAGRAKDGRVIGHHAAYLLGSRRTRTGDPPPAHR